MIFEGTGNLDNKREHVNNSGFLLSRKQNPVLYFDLRTSPFGYPGGTLPS
jgi:hypothetical protein